MKSGTRLPCDAKPAFRLLGASGRFGSKLGGVILAGFLFCVLGSRSVRAGVIDVTLVDERVVVDDAGDFKGAEIRAPQFCPRDTNWLSFEVVRGQSIQLFLYDRQKAKITEILPGQNGSSGRIGGRSGTGVAVQNTEFDWRPVAGPGSGERWFVFSSNVTGAFDLWAGEAVSGITVRIPSRDAARNERGPKWSPDGELIAYWSDARPEGRGDIYLLKYVKGILTSDTTKRLSDDPEPLVIDPGLDYEIRWYPGPKAGYLAYTHQDSASQQSRRVQVRVCDILERRTDSIQDADANKYLRAASWDPTGAGSLAFYQTDEYPEAGKEVTWGVGVARVEKGKRGGGALDLRLRRPRGGRSSELETSVQPSNDLRFGPVWTPDGKCLALTRRYEDKERDLADPVWLYRIGDWELGTRYRSDVSFAPAFKLPRDVTIQGDQIAFVYVAGDGTRKLLSARLQGRDLRLPKPVAGPEWPLWTDERAKRYDWRFVNRPGFPKKALHWVTGPIFKPNFGLNSRGAAIAIVVAAIFFWPPPPPSGERWNPPGFQKR